MVIFSAHIVAVTTRTSSWGTVETGGGWGDGKMGEMYRFIYFFQKEVCLGKDGNQKTQLKMYLLLFLTIFCSDVYGECFFSFFTVKAECWSTDVWNIKFKTSP